MGRTLPSITMVFFQEQDSFARFRRALRRSDQSALDELFAAAHQHVAAAAYAAHPLPFETFLLAMLLEEHKEVQRLRGALEAAGLVGAAPEPAAPVDPVFSDPARTGTDRRLDAAAFLKESPPTEGSTAIPANWQTASQDGTNRLAV